MKKIFLLLIINLLSTHLFSQYAVSGGIGEPAIYNEDLTGTGIEKVYVLNTLDNATITYLSTAATVRFYRYKTALTDKEMISSSDINTSVIGGVTTYVVSNLKDSYGYLVEEDGGLRAAIWIVDYSIHMPVLTSIEAIEDKDKCENLKLFVSKSDKLFFYANNGTPREIKRRYTINYDNLKWDEAASEYVKETKIVGPQIVGTDILIDAPLSDTHFTLRGDQFGEHFGMAAIIRSADYQAVSVKGHIVSEQEIRDVPNEIKPNENEMLGGSAPVTINFDSYVNEPVASFQTWFIYNKNDLKNPIARYTDKEIKYTFEEAGDYIVQLETADRTSTCVDTTSVTFNISVSDLQVPNYFSPDDSPGINDEFRVSYKSLVNFKCTIFNRWGTKLYEWTDPSKGWDGRYKGNFVSTGVYFYVIEAKGSDGKDYKRSGDINILRSR